MSDTDKTSDYEADPAGLRSVSARYAQESLEASEHAERYGRRHRKGYFVVGILAVVAGVIAGTTGIAQGAPVVTGIAGFAASALVGIGSTYNAETLARFHFSQGAGYGAISRRFRNLAEGTDEPTLTQVDELVERLGRWQSRSLQNAPPD